MILLTGDEVKFPLRCTCHPDCHAPFAYLVLTPYGYCLIIESRHHGEMHANVFPLFVAPAPVAERNAPNVSN